MSDKPKKRITGESVEETTAHRLPVLAVTCGRPGCELIRQERDRAHREGWDAAIEAAIRAERKRVSIRALPYPGIAKAEEPGT